VGTYWKGAKKPLQIIAIHDLKHRAQRPLVNSVLGSQTGCLARRSSPTCCAACVWSWPVTASMANGGRGSFVGESSRAFRELARQKLTPFRHPIPAIAASQNDRWFTSQHSLTLAGRVWETYGIEGKIAR
jgi:hypothetical protein